MTIEDLWNYWSMVYVSGKSFIAIPEGKEGRGWVGCCIVAETGKHF